MNRWMLTLDCSHRVASDDHQVEGREWCFECAEWRRVLECNEWEDPDA